MKNFTVKVNGKAYECEVNEAPQASCDSRNGNRVTSSVDGRVLGIEKTPGSVVHKGDVVLVVEQRILAPRDGILSPVMVSADAVVKPDDFLFKIEE